MIEPVIHRAYWSHHPFIKPIVTELVIDYDQSTGRDIHLLSLVTGRSLSTFPYLGFPSQGNRGKRNEGGMMREVCVSRACFTPQFKSAGALAELGKRGQRERGQREKGRSRGGDL